MSLVTHAMTQPSGRVLSLPSRYRKYLRCSPIISFLDTLAFLLRIFITPRLLSISLHQGLGELNTRAIQGHRGHK
jgi:hypothetical protein